MVCVLVLAVILGCTLIIAAETSYYSWNYWKSISNLKGIVGIGISNNDTVIYVGLSSSDGAVNKLTIQSGMQLGMVYPHFYIKKLALGPRVPATSTSVSYQPIAYIMGTNTIKAVRDDGQITLLDTVGRDVPSNPLDIAYGSAGNLFVLDAPSGAQDRLHKLNARDAVARNTRHQQRGRNIRIIAKTQPRVCCMS